jgi:hypothetical protein
VQGRDEDGNSARLSTAACKSWVSNELDVSIPGQIIKKNTIFLYTSHISRIIPN